MMMIDPEEKKKCLFKIQNKIYVQLHPEDC